MTCPGTMGKRSSWYWKSYVCSLWEQRVLLPPADFVALKVGTKCGRIASTGDFLDIIVLICRASLCWCFPFIAVQMQRHHDDTTWKNEQTGWIGSKRVWVLSLLQQAVTAAFVCFMFCFCFSKWLIFVGFFWCICLHFKTYNFATRSLYISRPFSLKDLWSQVNLLRV